MHTPVVCNLLVTKLDRLGELRWMPKKVLHGLKVADMHTMVDGACTDEVVTESVDIKCRPRKSWEVLQRCVA